MGTMVAELYGLRRAVSRKEEELQRAYKDLSRVKSDNDRLRLWQMETQEREDAKFAEMKAEILRLVNHAGDCLKQAEKFEAEAIRLEKILNTPELHDFTKAVVLEAAHQRQRWQDEGKTDPDWFWLIGYLAGKAIRPGQPIEKKLHHIITTAAACANWHAAVLPPKPKPDYCGHSKDLPEEKRYPRSQCRDCSLG